MIPELKNAFLYWRGKGLPALSAIGHARTDNEAGRKRYPSPSRGYGFGAAMKNGLRWGNPRNAGARFVGWQDELRTATRNTHKGWYVDDSYSETLRGCVYQLPARDGRALFLAGYREGSDTKRGWQDTCGEESAALDFSRPFYAERGEDSLDYEKAEAARYGDQLAEHAAEEAREYNEAWQAGSLYADCRANLATMRKELRALLRELKAAPHHTPEICKALRATVKARRRVMRATFNEAEEAKANVWREYYDAFNDGAGSVILKA